VDKMRWDGHRSSYPAFASEVEGTLLMIGMSYMLTKEVQEGYKHLGMEYIKSDTFWQAHRVGYLQVEYDLKYLYGMLQAATKGRANPYLVHHKQERDGLAVWLKFEQAYAHGGSKTMKSEELEEKLNKTYDPRVYKGLAKYIDHFQTWIEELDALGTRTYTDSDKKRMLIRNLRSDTRLLSLLQMCHDDLFRDFDETADYLRENGTYLDHTLKQANSQPSRMLNTTTEDTVTTDDMSGCTLDSCIKTVQNLIKETSVVKAYNALSVPTVRQSLSIPDAIWAKLEPALKAKVDEIRKEIRKKRAEQGNYSGQKVPAQYPMSDAQKVNAMVAHLCPDMEMDMPSDDDTDDEQMIAQAFHTRVSHTTHNDEDDIEVRAHLELVDNYSGDKQFYAILDGGVDSCVLGANAEVVSHTGRYATLVGYDPKHTRSKRIPIVTAYLKVKAHNGIPVLLKINEAVCNAGSPVTLLSEYQIRNHGYVVDLVATKHKSSLNTYGTQRMVLNDVVHVPFEEGGA